MGALTRGLFMPVSGAHVSVFLINKDDSEIQDPGDVC